MSTRTVPRGFGYRFRVGFCLVFALNLAGCRREAVDEDPERLVTEFLFRMKRVKPGTRICFKFQIRNGFHLYPKLRFFDTPTLRFSRFNIFSDELVGRAQVHRKKIEKTPWADADEWLKNDQSPSFASVFGGNRVAMKLPSLALRVGLDVHDPFDPRRDNMLRTIMTRKGSTVQCGADNRSPAPCIA